MNYHSNEWIMEHLQFHTNYVYEKFPLDTIIGVFLRGSQNYELDDENSDIDSILLCTPSINEICQGVSPKSETIILPNNEHIDVKDIRVLGQQILKQSPQFMECLFTPYHYINPTYQEAWDQLQRHVSFYYSMDKIRMLKAMRGYAHEKYHALCHPYHSRMEYIEKYGYDPKQLMHLARYKELVKDFTLGKPFPDILVCQNPDIEAYLRELKSGKFNLEAAQRIADQTLQMADSYANLFIEHYQRDDTLFELGESNLKYDIANFIKTSLKLQFEEEFLNE